MAQSRRRERELARRRFERRRLVEMQRREQRRRRNTILGSVAGVLAVVGLVVGLSVTLLGGGNGSATAGKNPPTGGKSASASPSASPSSSTQAIASATKTCKPVHPNPPAAGEPKFRNVTKAPTKLQEIDLKQGHGAAAKKGDKVTVKYVGVGCSSGKVFDASYTDGAPNKEFSFTIGQGQVIAGWDQGVPGMKVGGVRELVIPGSLAYQSTGSAPKIGPNAPLIFVVTLDKVSK